ncbi:MAG: TlpA disulfide reductase family protein [Pseudomonadota bacterium]
MKRLLIFVLLAWCALGQAWAGDFELKDTHGNVHKLSGYQGKWVVVNFWATWCAPCLDEIPELNALYEQHKGKDVVVIGVALDYNNPRDVSVFAENMFVTYPIVLGTYRMARQIAGIHVYALPTTFVFNPWGDLVVNHTGAVTRAGIERYIQESSLK